MLLTPNFSYYRNSEHIQFNKAVTHVIEEHGAETLHVKEQFDAFKAQNENMEEVFVTARKSEYTSLIEDQDLIRDNLFIGINHVINGYTKHFNPEKVQAATALASHIKKYGKGIPDMNYNAETAVLNDLIDGIDTDTNLKGDTVTLTIDDWFAELKAANDEFNRLYELRAKTDSEKPKENLKELRDESVKLYRKLTEYLHAASVMHPSEAHEKAVAQINVFIEKYNALRRKGKGTGEDEGDE
jgi:hypothetical protein